ncbi:MAG: DNA repair protein RadA [Myxococcaceae bacterium]|nr:DNA repair protein RadA [Myxococcaceae bacterium]MBH2006290.1 DNA repair protein RadA [Myxococcaceae bacterium]
MFCCQSCGQTQQKWMGKCPACQSWNTLTEEVSSDRLKKPKRTPGPKPTRITEVVHEFVKRYSFGLAELDRVLGGGLVPGSVTLISGEPGIGKSTLLLTCAHRIAELGQTVLYVSGEESLTQIHMTAERLGALNPRLLLLAETNLESARQAIEETRPNVLILDSVQTLYSPEIGSVAGSVSQIREVTAQIVQQAKSNNMATFLVGHVTKDGQIAGPRLLEHMVDTVLYFETARSGPYRFLRAHKNRFGSTQELGVFEMRSTGLIEVSNPSAFFLAERPVGRPGSAIAAAIEGSQPILVEVQALCVQTLFGNPRRTTVGIESTRCAMIAAVLEKHAGIALSGYDLFLNVAGGAMLSETAVDLPVAVALASSLTGKAVEADLVCFGEIGLSGEIRGIHRVESRLQEAKRMGFRRAVLPQVSLEGLSVPSGFEVISVSTLSKAMEAALCLGS